MADFPLVVTASGPQPTPPATLLAGLIASVTAINPGYTATLPGSLIEDISSTDVGALATIDSARVEAVNSLTVFGANAFTLAQLGQTFIGPGIAPTPPTNTSVFVVFTVEDSTLAPLPGYVIPVGFTVSDGTYQYVAQDGGVTGSNGQTPELFCSATVAGSWAVPTNTVSQIVSSFPNEFTITCTNQIPGTPGQAQAETEEEFRARVVQAEQAIATGTTQLLKTLLGQVDGVQQNLISTRAQDGGGWEIIVGGGDPYQVASAIFRSGLDVSTLVGSTLDVTAITKANPGVVTTNINHGLSNGNKVTINGIVGMTPLNGVLVTVTVVSEKTFSVGVDTSGYPVYVSGGVVTPNPRNITVSLVDPPDVYGITFVVPPQQTVLVAVTWNTTDPNFVAQASVAQLAGPPLVDYLNALTPGAPINLNVLASLFLVAVASILPAAAVSVLDWAVSINGIPTSPSVGTQLVAGDPESYYFATASSVTFTQG
jgi:Ubiquitin-activating enzyme E1 FCCH domain/Baseplate J-like protein